MCGNENGFYFLTLNLTIWGKKGCMTHDRRSLYDFRAHKTADCYFSWDAMNASNQDYRWLDTRNSLN